MNTEILFNIANSAYLIGTLLLIRKVIKNRNSLKDFDSYGSFLNVIGMVTSSLILIKLNLYSTLLISIPTTIFWIVASIYSFKDKKLEN